MKETKVCSTDTMRVPVRARYMIDKRSGSMTRSFEYAELTVKNLAEFLARKFGIDLPEQITKESGGDAV